MNKTATIFLSAFLSFVTITTNAAAEAPAGKYVIDPTHASLTWKVNHLGLSNYTARFTKLDAILNYDATDPTKSTLEVKVDPTSLETDFPFPDEEDFDKKLIEGEEWFNANKHKMIQFKSTRVEMTSDKTAKVHGDLTFLGVTKPAVLNVKLNAAMAEHPMAKIPALGFSATSQIKRSEFGMEKFIPLVGDNVQLLIEAEFQMR